MTVLTLPAGIAPFPHHTEFALTPVTGDGPLYRLTATAPDGPEFIAIDPVAYFPDYTPTVPSATADALELTEDNAAVLALVSIPAAGAAEATANLLAPIAVNKNTGFGAQVVLHDEAQYPVKAPLRR